MPVIGKKSAVQPLVATPITAPASPVTSYTKNAPPKIIKRKLGDTEPLLYNKVYKEGDAGSPFKYPPPLGQQSIDAFFGPSPAATPKSSPAETATKPAPVVQVQTDKLPATPVTVKPAEPATTTNKAPALVSNAVTIDNYTYAMQMLMFKQLNEAQKKEEEQHAKITALELRNAQLEEQKRVLEERLVAYQDKIGAQKAALLRKTNRSRT